MSALTFPHPGASRWGVGGGYDASAEPQKKGAGGGGERGTLGAPA